ncbi:MAG: D-cysteine desulfhydrase family protein [Pirellulales bacterium]|nr:D-cysteine desulfhydrase family protein [Pirellulales bacterium]
MYSLSELRQAVDRLPRVPLAHLPTPLDEAPRLSAALGTRVFVKRDDCTGLACGGNKTRHNEHLLAHALAQGAEMLVWGAGVQSNNCRQTAAACARLGLGCHLVLSRVGQDTAPQGNLLLDYLVGASVEFVDVPLGPALFDAVDAAAARYRTQGRRVYSWVNSIVKPRAAVSYVLCFIEIVEQLAARGLKPHAVYCSSAGSTGAGLILAREALGLDAPVRLVAPIAWPWDHRTDISHIANEAAALLGLEVHIRPEDVDSTLDYIGPGYGQPSEGGNEALALAARCEGILLDPVYTAKALAALIDDARQGRLAAEGPVIFIHTGGVPALFAYSRQLAAAGLCPGEGPSPP